MTIYPSSIIRQNYNKISNECKKNKEPVYLTKNGVVDLVVMNIEAFERKEKMLKLREELLSVEEDRQARRKDIEIDELSLKLDKLIEEL